jgi:hypothetical protein
VQNRRFLISSSVGPTAVIFRWIAALVCLSLSSPILAAEPCRIQISAAGSVGSRARSLIFPDGRELTIVGHNHGNRDLTGGTADSFRVMVSKGALTAAGLRADIERQMAVDKAAVTDSREGYSYLSTYLESHTSAKFVAVEASQATVDSNSKEYGKIRGLFLQELARLNLKEAGPFAEAQAYSFGSDFYLKLSQPILFKNRRLIGVEDSALGRAYLDLLPRQARLGRSLAGEQFDPDVAVKMNDFVGSMPARYPTYSPETDDASIIKSARAKFSAGDYAKIEPYIRLQLAVMRAMKMRDRHDAEILVGQNSSGIMFIGSAHLDSLTELLRGTCEKLIRTPSKIDAR